jgi:MFS superfamily sulfate permease-like transporter
VAQWSVKHREEQTRICEKYALPVIGEVSCRELTRADFQDNVHAAIRDHLDNQTRAVVIDAETVPAIDVTAVGMIVDLRDELTDRGIGLYIARDVGQVRDLLETAGGAMLIEHLCPSVDEAVTAVRDQPTRPEED